MFEVQLKVRGASMNAYDGFVTLHQTRDEREAARQARFLREAARLLNRVGNVRVLRDGVEVTA